jgi:hypothetical protein
MHCVAAAGGYFLCLGFSGCACDVGQNETAITLINQTHKDVLISLARKVRATPIPQTAKRI